uniref:Uncharacterized protein n=1 Tax=Solanum lycopersicum TaxID=4081 RepID=A0A3Q7IBG0_SOLLC
MRVYQSALYRRRPISISYQWPHQGAEFW